MLHNRITGSFILMGCSWGHHCQDFELTDLQNLTRVVSDTPENQGLNWEYLGSDNDWHYFRLFIMSEIVFGKVTKACLAIPISEMDIAVQAVFTPQERPVAFRPAFMAYLRDEGGTVGVGYDVSYGVVNDGGEIPFVAIKDHRDIMNLDSE